MADRAHVAQAVAAAAEGPASGLLDRLCSACAKALPVEGVAITVMAEPGRPMIRSTSDARVDRLEDLQYALGEGPGVSAFTQRSPFGVADLLRDGDAWPVFASEAAALLRDGGWPIRSVFAFPLQLMREPLGVLDVYRRDSGHLDPDVAVLTRVAVDAVVMALFGAAASAASEDGDGPAWLSSAADQVIVDQAVGMVMVQAGLDPEQALLRLRAHAFVHGLMVGQVADEVVARRLRLEREQA